MNRFLSAALAAAIAVLCSLPARAIDFNVVVLASCGTVPTTLPTGTGYSIFTDQNGNLCMGGGGVVTVAGTTSNASSAVATSATNIPSVAYNYGFNGTTWDQLQVDGSKNLKVLDAAVATTQAPVAPATATATKSQLIGAQATTAAVNPTTGQQAALSSDTNNNLLVSAGGAPNLATSQASVTTGNISVASARALRRAITITNVTGTGAAFCGNTGVTTANGAYLGATAGSSITLNTTAAVFCTVAATTQTVAVAETY